ncbi:excalibur calcium-binding domain-containing protein [Devosia sp. 1635]|uniref:excalibur calcium-binding domain-containing protein n=1 Tax=Devosia sp. 1635 TaxID=2726066 RepID=UPI0015651AE1|nr:excalibur calcium-binding domain-containing protein [Devosia sp. 1635]
MKISQALLAAALMVLSVSSAANAQGDMNCSDFGSWREAQDFYEAQGSGDPHGLDRDRDGIACESLQ